MLYIKHILNCSIQKQSSLLLFNVKCWKVLKSLNFVLPSCWAQRSQNFSCITTLEHFHNKTKWYLRLSLFICIPVSLYPCIPVSLYSWIHVFMYPYIMYPYILVFMYIWLSVSLYLCNSEPCKLCAYEFEVLSFRCLWLFAIFPFTVSYPPHLVLCSFWYFVIWFFTRYSRVQFKIVHCYTLVLCSFRGVCGI